MGTRTGGGNGAPVRLSVGDAVALDIPMSILVPPSGTNTETTGVLPEIVVELRGTDIRAGLYAQPGNPAFDVVLRRALDAVDAMN